AAVERVAGTAAALIEVLRPCQGAEESQTVAEPLLGLYNHRIVPRVIPIAEVKIDRAKSRIGQEQVKRGHGRRRQRAGRNVPGVWVRDGLTERRRARGKVTRIQRVDVDGAGPKRQVRGVRSHVTQFESDAAPELALHID